MNWIEWSLLAVAATAVGGWAISRRQLSVARRNGESLAGAVTASQHATSTLEADGARLRSRVEMLEAALDGAEAGILVADGDGAIALTNRAGKGYVGGRHGAAIATARVEALLNATLQSGDALTDEFEVRSPRPLHLRVRTEPRDGTPGAIAYVDDVTERRRVDAARRDFVANVSHELKTPLGALALVAETLQDTEDPATRNRLQERLVEQSDRMSKLVDDILDLSQVESGQQALTPVRLAPIVEAAVAAVRDIATAGGVVVDVDIAEDVALNGDARQLESAVGNLLSNAVTYTAVAAPPRRVKVAVKQDRSSAVIEVVDTGIGIPINHRERIFERFYRVDPARTRETGGTGLGLAIVRHVALNHGGTVEFHSESGVGSTFRMILPLADTSSSQA